MKQLLFLLFILPFVQNTCAQVTIIDTGRETAIALGEALDRDEIVKRFGEYKSADSYYDNEVYQSDVTIYRFDDASFEFIGGVLNTFSLSSPRYEAVILGRYRVRVGDSLSAFLGTIPDVDKIKGYIPEPDIRLHFYYESSLVLSPDDSGRIKDLYWDVPI